MKTFFLTSLLFLLPISVQGQSSGPDTPPLGSIVPEDLTFSIADATVAELEGGNSLGPTRLTNYTEFPDQVVAAVYHASW